MQCDAMGYKCKCACSCESDPAVACNDMSTCEHMCNAIRQARGKNTPTLVYGLVPLGAFLGALGTYVTLRA